MFQARCPSCQKWTDITSTYGKYSCVECNHNFEIPEVQVIVSPQAVGTYNINHPILPHSYSGAVYGSCSIGTVPGIVPYVVERWVKENPQEKSDVEKIKEIGDKALKILKDM
jgi:hypothetical protein